MSYQQEMKAIRLLQDRAGDVNQAHTAIAVEMESLKQQLNALGASELQASQEYEESREKHLEAMNTGSVLEYKELREIYQEADANIQEPLRLGDILEVEDFEEAQRRIDARVLDFNHRYSLDGWDYAIAGGCGLFAAMLDMLCIAAPPKPTVEFTQKMDGVFNRWVQNAFNAMLPPGLSKQLSEQFPIGAPDASTTAALLGAPAKLLNPFNHRLKALSHDPVLGVLFGVLDMMRGTCTVISDGKIKSFPSNKGPTPGNVFQHIGRMLGHLASDVNAPSAKGNRGMGLPAPFMGLLRMLEGIPVGDSNFGKQVEWMYVNGYDFRQFITSSVPMSIMEVLLRIFYVGKQMHCYQAEFGKTLIETMPMHLNPRFRIILALAYGTSSAVNAGKVYVTKNLLNANYASWMGLAWNGFHALRWALLERHLKLWGEVESSEITRLEELVTKVEGLEDRAARLPT